MYGDVVMGLKPASEKEEDPFEVIMDRVKKERGATYDTDLGAEDLKTLVAAFKEEILRRTGQKFPEEPLNQLWGAIGAVFGSWMNERAIIYRDTYKIPEHWGTAVNVMAMVFGNLGDDSGTGVCFTRDPATGEKRFYGEYLINAQGEDVVAGIRTPIPLDKLADAMPEIYAQLNAVRLKLEKHYRDMQDMEFTIQRGVLYMLQTRNGKRTGKAALKIAVDMVEERLITKKEALLRVEPDQLNQLLRPIFNPAEYKKAAVLAQGLGAGPGAASGRIAFTAADAEAYARGGDPVILVRHETSPEDIKGMRAALGILTARGGQTSHAALVARQMGKVCIVGCGSLAIDYKGGALVAGGRTLREGDFLSIDGTTGKVLDGAVATRPSLVLQALFEGSAEAQASDDFRLFSKLMTWADEFRTLGVWTNADQPDQAEQAVKFGAEGIGLCRTEHMFFGGDRIDAVREMILADDTDGRKAALAKLLPMQRGDFQGIFEAMGGRPATIRLLDPPLHEFLPHTDAEIADLSAKTGVAAERLRAKVEALHEFNPMLGHRGCRLGVTYPEIYEMQVQAILEAACAVAKAGRPVKPEIMIPLVGHVSEFAFLRERTEAIAAEAMAKAGVKVGYHVGTMIEIPRAALTAMDIGRVADFFSFGTNDLTQMTFGLSRDDSGRFLPYYVAHKFLADDPFVTLDTGGVGQLVDLATKLGRSANPKLKVGICGEHGGDPQTIEFCHKVGLTYVSCSPFRVPIARLAAAQAALKFGKPGAKPDVKPAAKAKPKTAPKKAAAKVVKKAAKKAATKPVKKAKPAPKKAAKRAAKPAKKKAAKKTARRR
jgi:pyruvate,orthophosphate dikinase